KDQGFSHCQENHAASALSDVVRGRTQCRVPNTSWPRGSECPAKPSSPDTRDRESGQRSPPREYAAHHPAPEGRRQTTAQSRARQASSHFVSLLELYCES